MDLTTLFLQLANGDKEIAKKLLRDFVCYGNCYVVKAPVDTTAARIEDIK